MNWTRQTWHVAKKDVRFAKWFFVATTAMTTALVVMASRAETLAAYALLGVLAYPLQWIAVAILVQSDSAVRVDAFWATRPLAPTAVLTAKVVAFFAGVLLPAAIGQLIILGLFSRPAVEIPGIVMLGLASAIVSIAIIITVASITPNITAALLTLFGLLIATVIGAGLSRTVAGLVPLPWLAGKIVTVALWVLLVWTAVYQYRTRDTRTARKLFAGWFVATALTTAIWVPAIAPWEAPPASERIDIDGTFTPSKQVERLDLQMEFKAPNLPPSTRVRLVNGRISVAGHVFHGNENLKLREPRPPLPANTKWVGRDPMRPEKPFFGVGIQSNPWSSVDSRHLPVDVRGDILIEEPEVVGRLPYAPDKTLELPGVRLKVTWAGIKDPQQVEVSWVALPRNRRDDWSAESIDVMLVNRRLGEAVLLQRGGGFSMGLPTPLPGALIQVVGHSWRPLNFSSQPEIWTPPEWLADAEIVFVHWRVAHRQSFHQSAP